VTEAYSNPLQTVIDEFKVISPEISNAVIFKSNGQTVASTKATTQDQTKQLVLHFASIASQAQSIGDIENLTVQAATSQLNISAMDNVFLATVSSRAANQEVVKSLTHVLVPTVVRLMNQLEGQPPQTQMPQTLQLEEKQTASTVLPAEDEPTIEPTPEPQRPFQPILPSTPTNQFMVEKIGGILVAADTVRIDGDIVAQWSELYGGKQFMMVDIEALDGKKTTCKFKAIKETKTNAKGIIQIPEKILQALQTEKGKLVMVKPVVE
jgi:hypothetical protein